MAGKRGRPASPQAGAKEAVAVILNAKNQLRLSDVDLATGAGVDQSTVNRLLRTANPTLTPALEQVRDYAENVLGSGRLVGPARRSLERELARIVVDLWDGTEVDAERLRRLFGLVREFRTVSRSRAPRV
jgi:hypothetical protein